MLRFYLLFPAALLSTARPHAEPPPPSFSRAEVIQRALHGNYALQVFQLEVERAQARVIDAAALPNPEIGLSGASDFAFKNQGEYSWSVSLSQQFPVTARLRLLRSIASQEVDLARMEIAQAKQDLIYQVNTVLDRIAELDAEDRLLHEQLQLTHTFRSFLQDRVQRAEASSLDVDQLQIGIAALKQRQRRLRRNRQQQLAELGPLLGFDISERFHVSSLSREHLPQQLPAFTQADLSQHPSHALLQQLLEIAANRNHLAVAERWGDITVELFFEQAYAMDEPMGMERSSLLGIGIAVPLPLHNRNHGAIESNRLRKRQLGIELQATGHDLLSRAESLRSRYVDLQQQIILYKQSIIEPAQANQTALEQAYATGQVSLTEVFRAQERLLELRTTLLELEAERASLLTQWQFATARNLP